MKKLIAAIALAACASSAFAVVNPLTGEEDPELSAIIAAQQAGSSNTTSNSGGIGGAVVGVAATAASGFGGLGILLEGLAGYLIGHMLDDIWNSMWGPDDSRGTWNYAP